MAGALRVALLNPCFWPEVRRGSERFARDLADGLIARGHRPRLLTSHPGRPTRTVEEHLPIARHWRPPESRLRRRGFEDYLTHLPFSYLSLIRGADDLAHALYPTDALVAAQWSRRTGRPAVMSYMGIPTARWLSLRRGRREITVRAVAGCTPVALSHTAAAEFRRTLGVDPRVIHPGVDLSAFTPVGERSPVPTIFCAAALDQPQKRVGLLVEAFALVRRRRGDAHLVLSRPRDPAAARKVGATGPGIELRDVDDRHVMAQSYSDAWVSALPSVGEAFGLVLVEALACGTPVVASDAGAIPEVVDRHSIGRLFPGSSPQALADALLAGLDLAEHPSTSAACRARAHDFSIDRCVEAYLALYEELLGQSGGASRHALTATSSP